MSKQVRSVAIVGRPNVGKSRLFNRLIGKRMAIVHDQPGVTRDVMLEEMPQGYVLMDTGGIGMKNLDMSNKEIHEATEEQVDFAIQAADLILFVVDAASGLNSEDVRIAESLRKVGKPVCVVVNKLDTKEAKDNVDAFYTLGVRDVIAISAEHGTNVIDLSEHIEATLGPMPEREKKARRIKICFAGKPNVGKSSLTNCLLKESRMIVSDVPGTTRDSIRANLDFEAKNGEKWAFQLIDTAGLKRKTKFKSSVEYFSGLRSTQSIENADVVFLVLDALTGVQKYDKTLAGDALESGRGLVIVVNKWDHAKKQFTIEPVKGYKNEEEFKKGFIKAIRKELFFLPDSPVIFTSARDGYAVEEILEEGRAVYDRMNQSLSTSKVNALLADLMERNKPHVVHGKRFKVYYAVQVNTYPFVIKFFCNRKTRLEDTYMRYLEKGFVRGLELIGCPIKFEMVGKEARYKPQES